MGKISEEEEGAASSATTPLPPHILVFPAPSQGHINPYLQFAKRLIFNGVQATLALTVFIKKSIRVDLDYIQIETISDGYDEGGFDSAKNNEEYVAKFEEAGSRTLAELIKKYQERRSSVATSTTRNIYNPFTCLLYDPMYPWALDVAKQLGVKAAAFFTQSCAVFAIYNHYFLEYGSPSSSSSSSSKLDLVVPGLPPLKKFELPTFLIGGHDDPSFLKIMMGQFSNLDQADWVFINSFDKLEKQVLTCLTTMRDVRMIGPTVPSMHLEKRVDIDKGYDLNLWKPSSDECMRWLDSKPRGSVVYVSFGSLAPLSAKQMEEVALGLKGSNKYFLWTVGDQEIKTKLPNNFIEEVASNKLGFVVTWCSQLDVLGHQAIGCFVTHCGWNSTLEALSLGVPLVAVPQWSDQPTNAKCIEYTWVVGARARRCDEEGFVTREEIEKCVNKVMEGPRRDEFRKNALKWKEMAKEALDVGGSSDHNVQAFVDYLVRLKKGT